MAFGFFIFIEFAQIARVGVMIRDIIKTKTINWEPLLNPGFIAFIMVDASIIGVFIKRRIGWYLLASTFYFFMIGLVYVFISSVTTKEFIIWDLSGIIFIILVILPIWIINTKEVLARYRCKSIITSNLIVIVAGLILIGSLYLARNL